MISFNRVNKPNQKKSAIELLKENSPWVMDDNERTALTLSCRDTDYIPKVKDAGRVVEIDNHKFQIMHNGIKVIYGGYFGDWMVNIIKGLKGHHEPQEEKSFYEILKRIDGNDLAMMELGAFWSYYSMWFKHNFPDALVLATEPDPINLEIGLQNTKLNNLDIKFIKAAAGKSNNKTIKFIPNSSSCKDIVKVKIKTVDSLFREHKLSKLTLLHIDVQGVELDALEGARSVIKNKQLRFIVLSTHHYDISGSVSTHSDCLNWIKSNGGYIIAEHNVLESFSGDGLIVASFDENDKNMSISMSLNNSNHSLFRSYEEDMKILANAYDATRMTGDK